MRAGRVWCLPQQLCPVVAHLLQYAQTLQTRPAFPEWSWDKAFQLKPVCFLRSIWGKYQCNISYTPTAGAGEGDPTRRRELDDTERVCDTWGGMSRVMPWSHNTTATALGTALTRCNILLIVCLVMTEKWGLIISENKYELLHWR